MTLRSSSKAVADAASYKTRPGKFCLICRESPGESLEARGHPHCSLCGKFRKSSELSPMPGTGRRGVAGRGAGCAEQTTKRPEWRQLGGPPLHNLHLRLPTARRRFPKHPQPLRPGCPAPHPGQGARAELPSGCWNPG